MKLYVAFSARFEGQDRTGRIIIDNCALPHRAESIKTIESDCEERVARDLKMLPSRITVVILSMFELES
jgi:hypothetical protein